jgi:hypothetical protein
MGTAVLAADGLIRASVRWTLAGGVHPYRVTLPLVS